MKKRIFNVVLIILVLAGVSFGVAALRTEHSDKPKYIFYFIGDGMSFNHILGTEQYNAAKEGKSEVERLNFSKFPVRNFVTNYSTSNLVTDSAAAGTALASGVKTANASIGICLAPGKIPYSCLCWGSKKDRMASVFEEFMVCISR